MSLLLVPGESLKAKERCSPPWGQKWVWEQRLLLSHLEQRTALQGHLGRERNGQDPLSREQQQRKSKD